MGGPLPPTALHSAVLFPRGGGVGGCVGWAGASSAVGYGCASPPRCLPCLCAEPQASALALAPSGFVPWLCLCPTFSRLIALQFPPPPTPTPKLLSWAAKSSSQKLGNILVRLLYNAAVNYMLTCLFVPASFSVDVDGPPLISNYSVVCFLLLLKCVAPCPARCALSNLSSKRN